MARLVKRNIFRSKRAAEVVVSDRSRAAARNSRVGGKAQVALKLCAGEEIGDCRASFHHRPVGKVDLSVIRILRDQTLPVALVQRVEMLVKDGLRRRLLFYVSPAVLCLAFSLALCRVGSCGHHNGDCGRQLDLHRFLRLAPGHAAWIITPIEPEKTKLLLFLFWRL